MVRRVVFLVACLLLARSASAAPTPTADYVFNGNLNSAVAGAPALTVVGGGITAFASESVLGSTQTVLTFPVGTGLALVPTTSVLSDSGVYTVIALVRLSGASCPCKYLDLDNRASDEGLYDIGSSLAFPGYPFLHDPVIGTDYVEIALTRAANGDQAGYVFANQKISFNDSLNSYGVVGAANTLNFFIDDVIAGGLEDSAGAVARIRIWNSALSPDEITAVSIQTVFRDGFE